MILRKPYAFLIKNFKLIHALLTVFLLFIAYKFNALQGFYHNLVKNSTYTYIQDMPSFYVPFFLYILIIFVILISIVILYLFKHKEKPVKFYFFLTFYYIFLFFFSFFLYNNLTIIEIGDYTFRSLQIIRDVLQILVFIQYGIILFAFTRATGFDIKKFNFSKDLDELAITDIDREEVEVSVEIDQADIKAKIKKILRHTKYFFVEHKLLIIVLGTFTFLTTSGLLYYNYEVVNKTYKEKDKYMVGSFLVQPLTSIDTIYNSIGEDISGGNNFFTAVTLKITNKGNVSKNLSINNMRIHIGKKTFFPIVSKYNSFDDLPKGYDSQVLQKGESGIFTLIFELDNRYKTATKVFECFYGGNYKGNELIMNYHKTILNPKDIRKIENITIKQKDVLNLKTLTNNANLYIDQYDFAKSFVYQYKSCIKEECHIYDNVITTSPILYDTTIMKIIYHQEIKEDGMFPFTNDFLSRHFQIQYQNNDKIIVNKPLNKLSSFTGSTMYLEIPEEVEKSNDIHLLIKIRNKIYDYDLK